MQNNSLIKENDLIIGDFFKIKNKMFIVDLDYYKKIFSDNVVLDFVKEKEIEETFELENIKIDITGNGEKAKYEGEKLKKKIKKIIDDKYEIIKKTIEAIIKIIPYNKFGIMDDYLIVLDDEYFRDKTKVVAYKYGGEMTMLGYLTNIIDGTEKNTEKNAFETFPDTINQFMLHFFDKEKIKIIHPIAIYY